MDRSIVRIPVYVGFGFAVFLIALALTFPEQRLKQVASVQMEAYFDNEYEVEIEDVGLWWRGGLSFSNVTLSERVESQWDAGPDDGGEADDQGGRADQDTPDDSAGGEEVEDKPMRVTIPRASAGFAPLKSLFNFGPAVNFRADVGGGDITGHFVQKSDAQRIAVDIHDIDLGETPIIEARLGVPVLGTLGGEAELVFDRQWVLNDGAIKLTGRKLMVDEAVIHTDKLGPMGFIDVPVTSFGNLDVHLAIEQPEGKRSPEVNFEEFRFYDGRDVRGDVWGNIELGRSQATSRARVEMRFQFADAYVRKNDLSSVMQLKWLREGKNKDWYGFVLWGRLSDPNFKGAPSAAGGPGASKGTGAPSEVENEDQEDKKRRGRRKR
jgi:type II secretion system protein N